MKPFVVSFKGREIDFKGRRIVRRYRDIMGIFQAVDPTLESENPVVYEVFEAPIPEAEGELMFLVTILYPGDVKGEYFMTKGHYHVVEGTAEVYLGLQGKGLILCQTKEGDFEAVEMTPSSVVYIPPYWAHRTVNVSDEPLVFFAVYPAHAGHDYETIEREGFKKRVFKTETGYVLK